MSTAGLETPRDHVGDQAPDPESEAAAQGLITVIQNYAAYFGYRHHVVEGSQPARDTLPKQTLVDRTEYAILEPGQAVGVADTDEDGVRLTAPTMRQRAIRLAARTQPALRSLVVNVDGSLETARTIEDTDEARQELEESGISIVSLVFEPAHTLGRPELRDDAILFPYDQSH